MRILVKLENEIIIRDTKETDINKIERLILSEFPNASFFVEDIETMILYQFNKGFKKDFGGLDYLPGYYTWKYYMHEKYPEFYPYLQDNESFNVNDFEERLNDIKENINKPIIIDKWKFKVHVDELESGVRIDPTYNQKYLNWIYKLHYENNFNMDEDGDKLNITLTDFDNPQVKALIKKAGYNLDINSYETDSDLWEVIDECYYSKLDDVEAGDRDILEEKRIIFENEDWLVYVPSNHKEAVTLGRRTNWCTSADSEDGAKNFRNYTYYEDTEETGRLFIFKEKGSDNMFQWSELHGDFLDKSDKEFEPNDWFSYGTIVDFVELIGNGPRDFKKRMFIEQPEKYSEYIIYLGENEKKEFIDKGKFLEYFKNDDEYIREYLAENGHFLDELMDDEFVSVICAVVRQHHKLDELIYSGYTSVRKEVAYEGYGLDILKKDARTEVKEQVLKYGYDLNYFLNIEDTYLRKQAEYLKKRIDMNKLEPYTNEFGFKVYFDKHNIS